MMSVPHKFVPYGPSGTGQYGKAMGTQNTHLIHAVKDKILKAVENIPVRGGNGRRLFTIGDYGTSDGSVSFPLFRQIIRLIPDPPSYLSDFSQVYVMATGTNFYHQILPDDSADLIVSFNAAQYLSELPTTYQNSLHRFPDATEEERKLATTQAAKDWESFLLLRAKELKSGGMLIVSMPCDDPDVKFKGYRHCTQDIEEGLLNMWRRFRDEGKITQEEFVNTNFIRCTRVSEEYEAPFEDSNSAVHKAGLRLTNAEQILVPCLTRKQWQDTLDKEGIDDRATWAKGIVSQHRCWTNSSFIRGLSSTRSESEKEAVVDEMYRRLEREVAARDPREYKNDVLMGYVFARKV